jgi:hypothetical protein
MTVFLDKISEGIEELNFKLTLAVALQGQDQRASSPPINPPSNQGISFLSRADLRLSYWLILQGGCELMSLEDAIGALVSRDQLELIVKNNIYTIEGKYKFVVLMYYLTVK